MEYNRNKATNRCDEGFSSELNYFRTLCSTRIPFQDCVCATSQHNTTWTFSFQTFRLFDISLTPTFSHIICVTIRPYSVSMINSCHCRQYLIHIVIHFERSDSSQFLSFYWFLQQGITIKSNIFRVFYDIDKVDIISFGFFFFRLLVIATLRYCSYVMWLWNFRWEHIFG